MATTYNNHLDHPDNNHEELINYELLVYGITSGFQECANMDSPRAEISTWTKMSEFKMKDAVALQEN